MMALLREGGLNLFRYTLHHIRLAIVPARLFVSAVCEIQSSWLDNPPPPPTPNIREQAK